jgi:hypothetical protein
MSKLAIIPEALASMTYAACMQLAVEETKKGDAADDAARQAKKKSLKAKIRAMKHFRNCGECLLANYAKGEAEGKTKKQVVEEFCAASGKSERTASSYARLAENWVRVVNSLSQQSSPTAAKVNNRHNRLKVLTSMRKFFEYLAEIDGQRSSGEDQDHDQDQDQEEDQDQDQDQEEDQDQDQDQEQEEEDQDEGQDEDQNEDRDEEEDEETECVKQLRHWWPAGTEEDHKAFVFEFDAQLQRTMEMVPENTETLSFAEAQKKRNLAS